MWVAQVCVDTNDAICLDIAEKDGMKLTNMIEFLLLELEQCEIGERDLEKNQKDDILSEDARVHIENMESQTSKLEKTIKELDILIEKTREKIVSEGSLLATLKQTADTEVGHNTALFNTKRKLTDRIRRLVESDDSLEQQRENLRNAVTTSERANEISKSKVRARMEVKTRTMATYRKVKAYFG